MPNSGMEMILDQLESCEEERDSLREKARELAEMRALLRRLSEEPVMEPGPREVLDGMLDNYERPRTLVTRTMEQGGVLRVWREPEEGLWKREGPWEATLTKPGSPATVEWEAAGKSLPNALWRLEQQMQVCPPGCECEEQS